MNAVLFTPDAVRELKRRAGIDARRYSVEVGERQSVMLGTYTANALIWHPEADLLDSPLFTGPHSIIGDHARGGMVLLDLYLYSRGRDSSLVGNVWVLADGLGRFIAANNDWLAIMQVVSNVQEREIAAAERRKLMVEAASKWRAASGMPKHRSRKKRAPLNIIADWAHDHDDETAAELLREAHALDLDL